MLISIFSLLERYRIQSEQFEDLWLITNELIIRLQEYFEKQGIKDFACSFSGSMPLQEYFELIDHHFEVCMIITHIVYNFSIYGRERDARGKNSSIYASRLSASSSYFMWMIDFVYLFLPSCPFCDHLQTLTECLPRAKHVVWLQNKQI